MRQALFAGVTALLMAVTMPVLLLERAEDPEPLLLIMEQPEPSPDPEKMISVETAQGLVNLPMETYLAGVVLSEMPALFEMEALKAQAVAARTFAEKQMAAGKHADFDVCADSRCCQAWRSKEDMREKLGDSWDVFWEKALCAVRETEGEVLTYNGELIDAVYFSCSGGQTEDAVAVWGSEVPYLQSVESRGEEQAAKFRSTVEVSHTRFADVLSACVTLPTDPTQWIGEVAYSRGGGVMYLEIGGQPVEGTKLRAMFGLNSTQFSVSVTERSVCFDVLGYGHRVGMSQYGANAMAKQGADYREILAHYYTGVTVECFVI